MLFKDFIRSIDEQSRIGPTICRGYSRDPHEESIGHFPDSVRWGKLPYCKDCTIECLTTPDKPPPGTTVVTMIKYNNFPYYTGDMECSFCTITKCSTEFHKNKYTKSGRFKICKSCTKDSTTFAYGVLMERRLKHVYSCAKKRYSKLGFTVTFNEAKRLFCDQHGCCYVSGIEFSEYLNDSNYRIVLCLIDDDDDDATVSNMMFVSVNNRDNREYNAIQALESLNNTVYTRRTTRSMNGINKRRKLIDV